jgi:hypothetical protein
MKDESFFYVYTNGTYYEIILDILLPYGYRNRRNSKCIKYAVL